MKIEFATPKDAQRVRQIWEYCFNDPENYNDFYFKNLYPLSETLIAKVGEYVVAAIHVYTYDLVYLTKKMKAALLVGISTLPEYRGQGIMHKMMLFLFDYLKTNNYHLMLLTAEQSSLYTSYDFRYVSARKIYDLDLNGIARYRSAYSISRAESKDFGDLYNFYCTNQEENGIYLPRNIKHFQLLQDEMAINQGSLYLIRNKEKLTGYFLASIEENTVYIPEAILADGESIRKMLEFIKYHQGQLEMARIALPANETIEEYVNWTAHTKIKYEPFMMARILDLSAFLSAEPFQALQNFSVEDQIISENNIEVRADSTTPDANKNTAIGIAALTQIIFNYYDLSQIEKLYGLKPNLYMNAAPQPFFNEYL